MTDIQIREYRPEDIPALSALWREVFGDSEALIAAFFRLLPGMGSGVVAETHGAVLGMAWLIDGLWLADAGGAERRCGYLYAVAVAPEKRGAGLGAALSRSAFELGRRRGAELLCTEPAEPGLFDWYARTLGVSCALRRRAETIPAEPGAAPFHEAEDYGARREALLKGLTHLRLSDHALDFQRALCADCGGGFYALDGAIAAAYREGGRAVIRELLAPEGCDRRALAAALAAQFGMREALLFTADPGGEPYLAALPQQLPPETVWGLSFD